MLTVHFLSTKIAKSLSMVITAVSIMAIDFPNYFPRLLVKTEDLGYSMMDTGVAIVMVYSGMSNRLII